MKLRKSRKTRLLVNSNSHHYSLFDVPFSEAEVKAIDSFVEQSSPNDLSSFLAMLGPDELHQALKEGGLSKNERGIVEAAYEKALAKHANRMGFRMLPIMWDR